MDFNQYLIDKFGLIIISNYSDNVNNFVLPECDYKYDSDEDLKYYMPVHIKQKMTECRMANLVTLFI